MMDELSELGAIEAAVIAAQGDEPTPRWMKWVAYSMVVGVLLAIAALVATTLKP